MSFNTMKNLAYMLRARTRPGIIGRFFLNKYVTHRVKKREAKEVIRHFAAECARRDFVVAFFPVNIANWVRTFRTQFAKDEPLRVLEIGSWEGMSTLFLLDYFPKAEVHAVDTWEGSVENAGLDTLATLNERFDRNVADHAARLVKHRMMSSEFFRREAGGEPFDLIYVDGSHYADDVVQDCLHAFARLKVGGVMIMDDYLWKFYDDEHDNPLYAINAFLSMKEGRYEILDVYSQMVIRRTR